MTTIINEQLLDESTRRAQNSPRLRMNYNFHHSLDELCHRMLNAVEPGTDVPIHRHPTTGSGGQELLYTLSAQYIPSKIVIHA